MSFSLRLLRIFCPAFNETLVRKELINSILRNIERESSIYVLYISKAKWQITIDHPVLLFITLLRAPNAQAQNPKLIESARCPFSRARLEISIHNRSTRARLLARAIDEPLHI